MSLPETRPNPYVGPRAFQTGETIYGRDHEVRELLDLLIAERIVLLHSPSGAGKSSLIQAGLIPRLADEGFLVTPLVRVNVEPSEAVKDVPNCSRYVFSVLLSLEEAIPESLRLPPEQLGGMSLQDYMDHYRDVQVAPLVEAQKPVPDSEILIFDQFEEILTTEPTDSEGKMDFFLQLGSMLRSRKRWALFAIREDYLAALEPYVRTVPTRLDNTYRLDLLKVDAAQQAIQMPARKAGVEFTSDAAARLLDDLRVVQVQRPDGTTELQLGPYVEPVQLQVVCYRLWQHLQQDDTQINIDDLEQVGDVNQSLSEYYAERVAAVSGQSGVKEKDIRNWFEYRLITESGLRSQVLMEVGTSAGLPNQAIRLLENAHVIRAEKRRGITWFELAHDRLIQPVRQNNAAWFLGNLSLLQRQAALWEREKKPDHHLLREQALVEAEEWANTFPEEMGELEKEFLAASLEARKLEQERRDAAEQAIKLDAAEKVAEAERQRAEQQARSARQLRRAAIFLALLFVVAAVLAGAAAYLGNQANVNAQLARSESTRAVAQQFAAEAASVLADQQRGTAVAESIRADQQRATAEAARALAQTASALEATQRVKAESEAVLRATAEAQALVQRDIALSRQRAALALTYLDTKTDLTLLLSIEAYRTADTLEARSAMLTGLQRGLSRSVLRLQVPSAERSVYSVSLSPDGKHLAWGREDGTVTIWDYGTSSSQMFKANDSRVWAIAYSPDGRKLASAGEDATITIWDTANTQKLASISNQNKILSLSWSPDGQRIAAAVGPHVVVWDVSRQERITERNQVFDASLGYDVNEVAWEPGEGATIAAAVSNKILYLLDATNGNISKQFTAHEGKVTCVAWSPDGSLLASGGEDNTVFVWETASNKYEKLAGHTDRITSVAFSFDGSLLATSGDDNDKKILLWDVPTRKLLNQIQDNSRSVESLSFLPRAGDTLLVSGSRDTRVSLYKIVTVQPLSVALPKSSDNVFAIAQYGQDSMLTARFVANRLQASQLSTEGVVSQLQGVPDLFGEFTSAALSTDGKTFAAGKADGSISVVDLTTGQTRYTIQGLAAPVSGLAIGDRYLASAQCQELEEDRETCLKSQIDLWDVASGNPVKQMEVTQHGAINALAISGDGSLLAAGGEDPSIHIFLILSGAAQPLPPQHLGVVTSLAFNAPAEGEKLLLASGSTDQTLILWDVESRLPIGKPLGGFSSTVLSLGFSAGNTHLYASAQGGAMWVWDASYSLWMQRSCSLAGRNLTQVEWQQYLSNQPYHKTCEEYPPGS